MKMLLFLVTGLFAFAPTSAWADCYANWHCNGGSAQCASIMGGYSGKTGPYSSAAECQSKFGQYMAASNFSCSCSGNSTSGDSTPGSSGNLVTESTKDIVTGLMNGNAQAVGIGMTGLTANALIQGVVQGMQGNPQAEAARQAQAAAAQQQQAAEQQQAAAEVMHQQELAKQRILGQLKDTDNDAHLLLKTDSDAPLAGELPLKLADDAKDDSVQPRLGFDTAGKIMGAELLPPPPTPPSASAVKIEKIKKLKADLTKSEAKEKAMKIRLEQLQQAPNPDKTAIKNVQQEIAAKHEEQTQIKKNLNLTAEDDDTAAAGTPPSVAPPSQPDSSSGSSQ